MTGRRKGTPCACETDPCSCGSSKGKCIRTINNLSPDPNGDFFIEAGSGITITQTGDNSFEVSFDGTLPSNPVIYKGTVGSGGTVAVLPAADPDNIGWMYIAVEAATSPVTYEIGDTLISDGYTWQVIPSGDDPVDWSQILNTPTTLAGYGITDAMQADTTPGVWAYTHSGIYQGQTAIAGNAAANSLLARDSDGCGQVADPLADTDSDYAVNVRTLNRRLTDGSVSKIGTVNVGSDTKPIKLVAGVPTAVTNDLVSTAGAQTVGGAKTFTGITTHSTDGDTPRVVMKRTNLWIDANVTGSRRGAIIGFSDTGDNTFFKMTPWKTTTATYLAFYASRGTYTDVWAGEVGIKTNGTGYMQAPTPDGNTASAVATVGFIDGYTPMLRTTGNQTFSGVKSISGGVLAALGTSGERRIIYKSSDIDITTPPNTITDTPKYAWRDINDVFLGDIGLSVRTDGGTDLIVRVRNANGTVKQVTLVTGEL